ncbi:MAG: RNA ligase family protein [Candidatus Accumulibacter sp.]|uniref:RNA ligase family protein n=1 Tax=Accumulibacter sp. TaxID=2053492 RepID=UPI002582BE36|nr:RNA ligase family protein [Accumulibacter sp.]MBK8117420.1 RNA ligase family protein [Accumulibacter sp.]
MIEFKPWPKIIRIENKRKPVFTEKIDGTNACVVIDEEGYIGAQSRNRFIFPHDDNFGFAKWVEDNKEDLLSLGPGHHYGEWWGRGIGRTYGQTERFFSLFNTLRWGPHNPNTPKCCNVIPIINANTVEEVKNILINNGSFIVPGWMKPEGAVMYEPDTNTCFKIILDK